MSTPATSYDLNNRVLDVSDAFSAVLSSGQGLIGKIAEKDWTSVGEDGKIYWLEEIKGPEVDTLNNGGAVSSTDTSFTVAHGSRFFVNMEIRFQNYYETMLVTGVSGNVVSVTRNFNSFGAVPSVADLSVIEILNRAENEHSIAHENSIIQPTKVGNYWESFREDLTMSKRILNTAQYGFANGQAFLNYNIEEKMRVMKERLAKTIVWGTGTAGTSTTPMRVGGLWNFLLAAGSNKTDASTAAISATLVNNMLYDIYMDDTNTSGANLVLYCDAIQARAIAGFNTLVPNRIEQVMFDNTMKAGNTYAQVFMSDIPQIGPVPIIVDKFAPIGTCMALNLSKIQLAYIPGGRMYMWDSKSNESLPGSARYGIATEFSIIVKDALYSHGLLYNLKKTL